MIQKVIRKKILIVIISIVILISLVNAVGAYGSIQKVADYTITIYSGGMTFTGSTTLTEQNMSNSVRTTYGNFNNVTKVSFSDVSASSTYLGKTINLVISNWYTYFDYVKGYTIYTHITVTASSPSLTRSSSSTIISDLNQPIITKTNASIIKEYDERHQEDTTVTFYHIKEVLTPVTNENITLNAGTFQTLKVAEKDYQNNTLQGSQNYWEENDGTLIKTQQYDSSGQLVQTLELTNLYPKNGANASPGLTLEPFLITSIVIIEIKRLKKRF